MSDWNEAIEEAYQAAMAKRADHRMRGDHDRGDACGYVANRILSLQRPEAAGEGMAVEEFCPRLDCDGYVDRDDPYDRDMVRCRDCLTSFYVRAPASSVAAPGEACPSCGHKPHERVANEWPPLSVDEPARARAHSKACECACHAALSVASSSYATWLASLSDERKASLTASDVWYGGYTASQPAGDADVRALLSQIRFPDGMDLDGMRNEERYAQAPLHVWTELARLVCPENPRRLASRGPCSET